MIKVGIYGASGYTGFELTGILLGHPEVELVFATSASYAGKKMSEVFPCLLDLELIPPAKAEPGKVEAVFCCLPHTASMETIRKIYRPGLRVIDLSADFRFSDPEAFRKWYGVEHVAPELIKKAAYGLPELFRREIALSEIVGNPGCYPTGAILAVAPLAAEKLLEKNAEIIIDAKSGVSGAGRKLDLATHFVEVNENIVPYKLGRTHRHVGEIEAVLSRLAGRELKVAFTPQLVPISRGILSTVYVRTGTREFAEIVKLYRQFYRDEPFVTVLEDGQPAQLGYVRYNNRCVIGLHQVEGTALVMVSSAIDNLVKGAAGQAVHNFNIMFGISETTGLTAASGRI
ncbi:MAG: N-acetyl-gamma-glutamyl-phosphate reductase [Candidatus Glassbacteria bacterium]